MAQFLDGFHKRSLDRLGSARVSRAGFCVSQKRTSSRTTLARQMMNKGKVRDREDAIASPRDARAPQLESILRDPPIKRAPAQPQRFRGLPRVAVETGKRLLDQERFHLFETHVLEPRRVVSSTR